MQVSRKTLEQLRRPLGGVVSLNDVFATSAQPKSKPWVVFDPDAAICEWFGNRPYAPLDMQIYLDTNMPTGGYLSVLIDDLRHETSERLDAVTPSSEYASHPDTVNEMLLMKKAQALVLNSAPRSPETTHDGHDNGRSFYLAITTSGIEVYATPITQLSALEKRHRVLALYEISNHNNPAYKDTEQFRSRLISRVRRSPECLKTIFEYANPAELLAAKRNNTHPSVIPTVNENDSITYIDRFGNIRLELHAGRSALKLLDAANYGKAVKLRIGTQIYEATIVDNLSSAPAGKLAIYTNKSDHLDHIDEPVTPIYAELVIHGDVTKPDYVSAADTLHNSTTQLLGTTIDTSID